MTSPERSLRSAVPGVRRHAPLQNRFRLKLAWGGNSGSPWCGWSARQAEE